MGTLTRKAVVVGIGETPYTTKSGMTDLELQLWACKLAAEDAGLSLKDVDCLLAGVQGHVPNLLSGNMGLSELKFNAKTYTGGGEPGAGLALAAMLFEAGMASVAIFYSGYNGRSGGRWGTGPVEARRRSEPMLRDSPPEDYSYSEPFGHTAPSHGMALQARRHMHQFGTTSRQFGAYAVAARKHASMNDNALMREPITVEDHQNSPMISDPFRLLDCSIESDGAAAFVMTTPERARDLKHPPVHLLGFGHNYPPFSYYSTQRPDILEFGTREAGKRAFEYAGVTPKDIDLATITDPFSFMVIRQLELLGFCKEGEGGPFVEGGRIELGGELPVNTHGGAHSHAQVGYVNHMVEAVCQLRHEAGSRQVQDAGIALISGFGYGTPEWSNGPWKGLNKVNSY